MISNSPNGEATKTNPASSRASGNYLGVAESLRHLRSQTPEESLGLAKETGLLMPSVIAAILAGILLAGWTTLSYVLSSGAEPTPATTSPEPEKPESNPTTPPPTDPGVPPSATTKPAAKPSTPKSKDLLDILGENGTKKANPSINPLDKKDDDILKEIK